jgi:PAS domain S-box-containing protein
MPDAGSLIEIYLDQCPACQWMVSADRTFLRVYGDATALFGRPSLELAGRAVSEALGKERANAWQGRFQRALEGETLSLREHHGKGTWEISVFPIRVEGEIRFAGGMAREITPWNTAEQELRHTVHGAMKAQEFERAMVSKFLHDSVGQNMTALGLQLDLIRMDLETISPETCVQVAQIQKTLEDMMEKVREYSYKLNPSTVERAGLRSALDGLAEHTRASFTGSLRVNVDPALKLDPKLAAALYQIVREAVDNAVHHSGCTGIEIALKSTRTGTILEVRDNGTGFDPADLVEGRRGLGLLTMEHFAAEAGLELSITSARESGTTVRATLPKVA